MANLTDILQKVLKSLKYSGHPPKYMNKGWAMHYTGFSERYFDRLVELKLIDQYSIKELLFPEDTRNTNCYYSRKQLDTLDESIESKIDFKIRELETLRS